MQRFLAVAMLAGTLSVPAAAHASGHPIATGADPSHTWIYVAGAKGTVIDVFDLEAPGMPRIGRISRGLHEPAGMTVGPDGTLYAANINGGKPGGGVVAYAPGATSPTLTLTMGLTVPVGVAVDASGNVYVANRGGTSGIVIFPKGATSPSAVITSKWVRQPNQLVFDRAGNLFFTDYQLVGEVPHGSLRARSLGLTGLLGTGGIALGPSHGDIFISNGVIGPVMVYGSGDTGPRGILRDASGACFLASGKVAGNDYIFVPSCSSNTVWVFRPAQNKPAETLHLRGAGSACCIAIKPAGIP
jgi:hypothetical protein